MKKKVLLSVFAASLFAAAPAALATNGEVNHEGGEATPGTFFDANGDLTQGAKDGLNNVAMDATKGNFKAAGEKLVPKKGPDGKVLPGEFVVEGKAPAKKAMAPKAGQKALPKTSAVK